MTATPNTGRLLIANLDCEQEWAAWSRGKASARSGEARPAPPDALPTPVRRMLSSMGALLAALSRPGDTLWTPLPVARARLADSLVGDREMISGALAGRSAPGAVLAWGETET
ncbi:MAG: hypothetical protein AAGC55_08400, partial [Myxococcota bacterium]